MMMRIALAATALALTSAFAPPQDPDEARKLAEKITAEGAAAFDARNAPAMTAFYAEDAQLMVISKDKDTNEIKVESKKGRAEIEGFYRQFFESGGESKSKNTVEGARRIDPDILQITGTFQPDVGKGLSIPFIQVRVKQGEKWLIKSLQIFVVPQG